MDARKDADLFLLQAMILLCAIWGFQQVAIKVAADDVAPVLQTALRSGLAMLLVALVISAQGAWQLVRRRHLLPGLLAGGLFALEFLFVALGLRYTSASHMVVFLYTAPIFAALGLHGLIPGERLRLPQWAGVGLCFGGIVVAFLGGFDKLALENGVWLGDLLGLLAGLSWGLTTVVVRGTSLSDIPPSLTLFYQLLVATLFLLAMATGFDQWAQVTFSGVALVSLLFQGVVVSFVSYFSWFWLLRRYKAGNMGVFSFLAPLFGVGFGVMLLNEPLSGGFVVGAVLVLMGMTLVSAPQWVGRQVRRLGSKARAGG